MLGSSASMLGSGVTSIAYPMLALYLTGSPLKAGWVACAAVAPRVITYIPAGVLVDRWDPRRVMLLGESGRGAVVAVVVFTVAIGSPSVFLLVCCAIAEGIFEAFPTLAERCYVRSLVEPDQASSAQARMEARTHLVVLIGRPLGLLLFWINPIAPFAFDVLTYIISVIAVFKIKNVSLTWQSVGLKYRELKSIIAAGWPSEIRVGHGLWDAIVWLVKERRAFSTFMISAGATLIFQALIIVTLADAHAHDVSRIFIGMMLAASGAGGAVGSILLAAPLRKRGGLRLILFQAWSWPVAFAILGILGSRSLAFTVLMMSILGLTGALGNIELHTQLAQGVSDGMLARVTSIVRILSFAACAVGSALGGLLAQDKMSNAPWVLFAMTVALPAFLLLGAKNRKAAPEPCSITVNPGVH
jgi:MFS family permease